MVSLALEFEAFQIQCSGDVEGIKIEESKDFPFLIYLFTYVGTATVYLCTTTYFMISHLILIGRLSRLV